MRKSIHWNKSATKLPLVNTIWKRPDDIFKAGEHYWILAVSNWLEQRCTGGMIWLSGNYRSKHISSGMSHITSNSSFIRLNFTGGRSTRVYTGYHQKYNQSVTISITDDSFSALTLSFKGMKARRCIMHSIWSCLTLWSSWYLLRWIRWWYEQLHH